VPVGTDDRGLGAAALFDWFDEFETTFGIPPELLTGISMIDASCFTRLQ
jgi:hypothetical protein